MVSTNGEAVKVINGGTLVSGITKEEGEVQSQLEWHCVAELVFRQKQQLPNNIFGGEEEEEGVDDEQEAEQRRVHMSRGGTCNVLERQRREQVLCGQLR